MKKIGLIFFTAALLFVMSCTEKKELPEENQDAPKTNVDIGKYSQTVLPSLIGYIYETYNGIGKIISYELKSDNKSQFIALVFQKTDSGIQSINFHFEGEYNGTKLSVNNPFLVICECDDLCKDCGFKTTAEGVVCGCMNEKVDSPCVLTIDHITDFDFYANYHKMGLDLFKEYGIK
jgi:hypothetical protein